MLRAIIYCRKSTDREDKQVQSLDDQLAWCRETAKTLGYEVVEEISEAISAKTPEKRPGFKRMLSMIKKGEANTIITWKCNRLARNPIDQSYIEWYLQEGVLKEIVSTDGFFRTGDNVLILRMHFGMSTQFIIDLKKDTMRGMRSKVEKGGIVSKPPLGYISINGEAKRGEFFDTIKKVYMWRKEGMRYIDISDKLYKEYGIGTKTKKPFSAGYIESIIKNPFYYGVIKWAGELFCGTHEAMISQEEWESINGITRGVIYKHNSNHPAFRLKGIIALASTGRLMTATLSKGNVYFHNSSREKKVYFKFKDIIEWFDTYMHLFELPKWLVSGIRPIIESYLRNETQFIRERRQQAEREEKIIEAKKTKLLALRMDNEITQEEFLEEKNKLVERLATLREIILQSDTETDNILEKASQYIENCTNLSSMYKTGDIDTKIDIIKMLCTNLYVTEDKKLVVKMESFWEAVHEANNEYGQNEEQDFCLENTEWCPELPLWSKAVEELIKMCKYQLISSPQTQRA